MKKETITTPKFTKKNCELFLSGLKMEKFAISLIVEAMEICIKHKTNHVDLVMKKVYSELTEKHHTLKRELEWDLYKTIKSIDKDLVKEKLGYNDHITNKKFFILLLERYGY